MSADARGRISVRSVWRVLAGVALAGALVLVVLAYTLWRSGRVPGVRTLPASPGAIAVFEGSFPAGGAQRLVSPRGIAVTGERVYVVEPDAARVSVFALDGRLLARLPVEATGAVYPVGIAADADRLYIVDAAGGRLLAMPARGGAAQPVDAGLRGPTAVAFVGGELVVGDAERGLVRIEPRRGRVAPVAPEARFFFGGIAVMRDGVLVVSDATGSRLWRAEMRTGALTAFGDRVNLPRGVAVDGAGRVWVADVFGGTVVVFDASGERLGELAGEAIAGPDAPRLIAPEGLAFAPAAGRIYVTDARQGLVYAFGVRR